MVLAFILVMFAMPAWAAPAPNIALQSVQAALRDQSQRSDLESADVLRFYGARDFRPVWIGNPDAGAVIEIMEASGADGLDPERYVGKWLASGPPLSTPAEAAHYEWQLTAGLLRYAQDLRRGQVDPARTDRMVGIERPWFDVVLALEFALQLGNLRAWLADLAPTAPAYARLKLALARYRELAAAGGWPMLPYAKKIGLEPGNPELAALQQRLAAEDRQITAEPPVGIADLKAAVRRFQARNGLDPTGTVGRLTIEKLNISAADRVKQILANMERWRWLPHALPSRYIMVNAADASLKAIDKGNTVLTSRVIVGKKRTPTAMFNADVNAVTLNPFWNVPASIVRNEIRPKLRRNPGYLRRHHMVWKGSPARIVQLPGAHNALGYLKLEMPNSFDAYLHDTSTRKLFKKDKRFYSHGCIRVQNIRPLASFVLTGSTEAGLKKINAAIASGRTQKLMLDKPVPVLVVYWTAIAEPDGTVEFRPDVYGRDKRLLAALAGRIKVTSAAHDPSSGCMGWKG